LLHVDTGHNFPKPLFRDKLVAELGLELIVRNVQDAIDQGKVVETGKYSSRNSLQNHNTLDAIEDLNLMRVLVEHVVTRKKPELKNVFFLRDDFGQWDEKSAS
jgi:sulfate adenylyltransferase subunit 2